MPRVDSKEIRRKCEAMADAGTWRRYLAIDINDDGTLRVEPDAQRHRPVEQIITGPTAAVSDATSDAKMATTTSAVNGSASGSSHKGTHESLGDPLKVEAGGGEQEVVLKIGETSTLLTSIECNRRIKSATLWVQHLKLLRLPEVDALFALGCTVVNGLRHWSLEMGSSKADHELSRIIPEIEAVIEALRSAKSAPSPQSTRESAKSSRNKAGKVKDENEDAGSVEYLRSNMKKSSSKERRIAPRKSPPKAEPGKARRAAPSGRRRSHVVLSASETESESSEAEPVLKRAKTAPSLSSSKRVPSIESVKSTAKRKETPKGKLLVKPRNRARGQSSSKPRSETESETQSETESVTESETDTPLADTSRAGSSSKVQAKTSTSRRSVSGGSPSKSAETPKPKKSSKHP